MAFENPNAGLAAWKQKMTQSQNKEVVNKEVPVEAETAEPETTEEPIKPVAQEVPKEQPEVEEAKEPVEEPKATKAWYEDDEVEQPKKTESPSIDYSRLGSALELEIKSEEELVAKFREQKSKLKEFEDKPLAGVPDEFKEVLEVAKTGDWKDYLANQIVDYSKFDPIQEFENEFYKNAAKNPKFIKDGQLDQDAIEDALATIPEYLQDQHGRQLLQQKTQAQHQRQMEIKQRAQQKIDKADKVLSQAVKNLNELLPIDGFKFDDKISTQVYKGITNSTLTKKHLGASYETLVREGFDMNAVAATITMREYGEKMIKHRIDNEAVKTKKEILDKTQNAQLNPSGSIAEPQSKEKKEATPVEKLAKYIAANKKNAL